MFCMLWVIFQTFAVMVEGGVSSGSVEALINGGANTNGVAPAASNAIPALQNGVPANGDAIVARLIQVGGSYFIQPVGNPVGQAPLQQLTPITALQQGGAAIAGPAGGANRNLQGQLVQAAGGAPVTLFAMLPQGNTVGAPQHVILTQGQLQTIPLLNNQQQLGRTGGVGARFLRSLTARPKGTQTPALMPRGAEEEEEEEEEEECSGNLIEDNQ